MAEPDTGPEDGEDLSPDQVDEIAGRVAGEESHPEAGEADGARPEGPAEHQAIRELRTPVRIMDALVRTAAGAAPPEDMDLDLGDGDGRADLASRMLAPAYQRAGGQGVLDWRVKALIGLGVIVVPALIEGQLGGGDGGEDGDEEEPAPLPDGVRRPDEAPEAAAAPGGERVPTEEETESGVRLSVGKQSGGG